MASLIQKSKDQGLGLQDMVQQYQQYYEQQDDDYLQTEVNKIKKSNFFKNILRSFIAFIKYKGDEVVIESIVQGPKINISQIRKEFKHFIKNKSQNQSTLVSFLKSKRYSQIFQYYLNYYSCDWIINGFIQDVQKQVLCIEYLKRCSKSKYLIEQIRTYKKQV